MITWMIGQPSRTGTERRYVVSVGSYDGVHKGHQAVIERMTELAREKGLDVLVAAFEPHPRAFLHGEEESRLTTLEERGRMLVDVGVDAFVTLTFDNRLASMEPEVFVSDVLINRLGASVIAVGHDHRFGKGRRGDIELLRGLGGNLDFEVVELSARKAGGSTVSSSRIRSLIAKGDVSSAARLLGRYHTLSGLVIRGAGRGRKIGIPTANLSALDPLKLVPENGVYAVRTFIRDKEEPLQGMMNIGQRPTFEGEGMHLEVNIIDWSGDLYGSEVRVEFVDRIRDEQKFDGVEALIRQLNVDRERCRALLQDVT